MELQAPEVKADLTARLRRIEGQVRGVQKMVEGERDCTDILQQLAAIRSAVHQTSLVLARAYAARCLLEPTRGEDLDIMLDQLMATLRKLE
jgi:DNA-binding FrmR family transcriptional regulator